MFGGLFANTHTLVRADPVNTATGSFVHRVDDVSTPGRGVTFSLSRSYDSQVSTAPGPFGPGWGWNLGERIVVDAATSAATWKSGTGSEFEFASDGSGGFISRPGVLARLTAVAGGGFQVRLVDQTTTVFNAAGLMISKLDRSGQGLSFAYDGSSRLVTVTDASSRAATLTYGTAGDALGLLTSVKTADGRSVNFGYATTAGAPRLVSAIDERAKTTTYAYDPVGRVVSEVDPAGHTQFTNTYDTQGRVLTQADQLGNVSTFSWNDTAHTGTFTDASGAVRVDTYASFTVAGTAGPEGTTASTYDAGLNATGFTDQTGAVWAATYDTRGNMLTRKLYQ